MPGKRGNREGHIRQRKDDGRWEVQITVTDGKRASLYGKTRDEVRAKLTKAQRERDQGLPGVHNERQTVAAYLTSWLAMVKTQVRECIHLHFIVLVLSRQREMRGAHMVSFLSTQAIRT
jgi:hypothetical protein